MVSLDKVISPKSDKSIAAKQTLEEFVLLIDQKLSKFFDGEIENAFGVSDDEKKLSQTIWKHIKEHNLRPAKRIRGAFVYFGYQLLGGKDLDSALSASMSIELVHTTLLMHDDIMDQDDTRRGLATTHEYFKSIHSGKNYRFSSGHYGESMAINLGDIALFAGNKILSDSNFPTDRKIAALSNAQRGLINTGIGQSYDVTLEASGKATEEDILHLHYAKTGIYTYENPLHTGATLAGASKSDLEVLSLYAIPGGIAFQLQDDILGFFGDPEKTGKPAHSDIRQGKMTLLIIKAFKLGTNRQVSRLKEIWGKHDLTEMEAKEARSIVKDCGSLEYSKQISIKYAKEAQKAIPLMIQKDWQSEAINYLDGIAQYMVEREM